MDLFDLYATISLKTEDYQRSINIARGEAEDFASQLQRGLNNASRAAENSLRRAQNAAEFFGREVRDTNESTEELSTQLRTDLTRAAGRAEDGLQDVSRQASRTADNMQDAGRETNDLSNSLINSGEQIGKIDGLLSGLAGKIKKGFAFGAIIGGVTALTGAITSLVDETEEFRKIIGTLETSSEAAGYTAEETAEAYKTLYSVLGDTQTAATTVANLQALGLSQKDLMSVTNAAIGAWATYGDSIPIDGLAEAINETIRAGQVTGTFADVLNWGSREGETFGVTMLESTEANKEWNASVQEAETAEDYFNLALQKCSTEAERADLVLRTMASQGLVESAAAWKENNSSIIETNEAQLEYEDAQARLAERLVPVKTALTNLAAGGFDLLTTAIDKASAAVADFGAWWDRTRPKIESAWDKFWGIESGSHYGRKPDGSYGWIDGSHAGGLGFVPFDGYIAQLHKGEMVLTREQADSFRDMGYFATVDFASSGLARSQGGISSALQNVAASIGQDFTIVVQSVLDGKVIGETAYQYSRNKARAYGK